MDSTSLPELPTPSRTSGISQTIVLSGHSFVQIKENTVFVPVNSDCNPYPQLITPTVIKVHIFGQIFDQDFGIRKYSVQF